MTIVFARNCISYKLIYFSGDGLDSDWDYERVFAYGIDKISSLLPSNGKFLFGWQSGGHPD
jgi:hypothetical protein